MNFTVINHEIKVGTVNSLGVSSSALFLVGDANLIISSSILDTPFESVTGGPFVPLVTAGPTTPR
ncbi:spore gernimation protein GerPD [Bacillus sp. AFS018417]|uniref:spore gernimation protein GerPD n=1 Tax=Bacillus sp. AFS018417 TaxID=2033491 RepID=UPI000BF78DF6|nr:spore gernimation protein GerPD [Bacillus sp. AFS018417]PEZ09334.1 spore gernimation protein GerPD [Bacillus sp. AFS018417]